MSELMLFSSSFALVFFLGLQSLNTNRGHYVAAFFTSFAIGISNLMLFKLAPEADPSEMVAFILGGPGGIVSSMLFHKRFFKKKP